MVLYLNQLILYSVCALLSFEFRGCKRVKIFDIYANAIFKQKEIDDWQCFYTLPNFQPTARSFYCHYKNSWLDDLLNQGILSHKSTGTCFLRMIYHDSSTHDHCIWNIPSWDPSHAPKIGQCPYSSSLYVSLPSPPPALKNVKWHISIFTKEKNEKIDGQRMISYINILSFLRQHTVDRTDSENLSSKISLPDLILQSLK